MRDPAVQTSMDSHAAQSRQSIYQIAGIPVEFPYKPYGSQFAFMGRVISTLDRAQRQGHCHALLESPTGTGKSLSLLCSALAWQKNIAAASKSSASADPPHSSPNPLTSGGGFISETEEPGCHPRVIANAGRSLVAVCEQVKAKRTTPPIYYATRTHAQIHQLIREYRKTSYRVPMAILASRKHYCTNKHICGRENVDDECRKLLKKNILGCPEFRNVHKISHHPSLKLGGCNEVHDIEDLVKIGQAVKGCPYFAAWNMSAVAQLVFCPYNYIISPAIRKANEVDLKGSIIIFDEAHNIEDMIREAGSFCVDEEVLDAMQTELGQLCLTESEAMLYQPLYDMIQGIISWIEERKGSLRKHEFEHYLSCWTGESALNELREAGITEENFKIVQECTTKAIKVVYDSESDGVHLSDMAIVTLEGFVTSFSYFFSGNGIHTCDYYLALKKYVKRDATYAAQGWSVSMNLWLLNPAVLFKEIAALSRSVILTSGTLSPMVSFSSELGIQFESCLEAPHVIDVENQLWAGVISHGPSGFQMNGSYKAADAFAFQDAVGASLEEIFKIVVGGALVFFPSYKLLEKLHTRWIQTGQWSRLNSQKSLFVESRGTQGDFDNVLKRYYDAVDGNKKNVDGRVASIKKSRSLGYLSQKRCPRRCSHGSAAFLAVCRGKVSEGIDFSDEYARVVVIVGIPFPSINDIQVQLKKRYNDMYKSSKNLVSGNQWYNFEAFRALNQAIGRCIRHQFDYGAIILLDERFREGRNIGYFTKWVNKSLKQYERFDVAMEGLRNFFKDKVAAKEAKINVKLDQEYSKVQQTQRKRICRSGNYNAHGNENAEIIGKRYFEPRRNWSQVSLSDGAVEGDVDTKKLNVLSEIENIENAKAEALDTNGCRNVDFLCSIQNDSSFRCSDFVPEISTFKHTGTLDDKGGTGKVVVVNSVSAITDACSGVSAPQRSLSSTANLNEEYSEFSFSLATPERYSSANIYMRESESPLETSVNSHRCKRLRVILDHRIDTQADSVNFLACDKGGEQQAGLPSQTNCSKHKQPTIGMLEMESTGIFGLDMDRKLKVSCSFCKSPLGLPQHNFFVPCTLRSSFKSFVTSFHENTSKAHEPDLVCKSEVTSVAVLIADKFCIDQHLFSQYAGIVSAQCVWCEKDGCVFKAVTCCFCFETDRVLGLQVMAADASNIELINKVFFYADCLLIEDLDNKETEKELLPCPTCEHGQASNLAVQMHDNSCCLSITKSKMRLPRGPKRSN